MYIQYVRWNKLCLGENNFILETMYSYLFYKKNYSSSTCNKCKYRLLHFLDVIKNITMVNNIVVRIQIILN